MTYDVNGVICTAVVPTVLGSEERRCVVIIMGFSLVMYLFFGAFSLGIKFFYALP